LPCRRPPRLKICKDERRLPVLPGHAFWTPLKPRRKVATLVRHAAAHEHRAASRLTMKTSSLRIAVRKAHREDFILRLPAYPPTAIRGSAGLDFSPSPPKQFGEGGSKNEFM
jgi:hypothetical protein